MPLTSLVTGVPSPVNIGCLESSKVFLANYSDVLGLYAKFPELNKIGRVLTELAWIGKQRRETQFDARQRYMAFLEEYPGLGQRIPQYHSASYLGITPVQLSRIRSQKH